MEVSHRMPLKTAPRLAELDERALTPITATNPGVPERTRQQDRMSAWIDAHPSRAFALLTAFYALATACLSHFKLLWMDELITVYIVKLGSVGAIWHALSAGADPNPPLTHLSVLACMRLFGTHTYVFRIPAILGYWAGMLGLFLLLKRYISPTYALLGVIMSMGMGAFEWSYECRSYPLYYGTTMLALLCWNMWVRPSRSAGPKYGALACMTLFLAAGLCANFFSVIAFVPIGAGELTRTVQRAWTSRRNGLLAILGAIDWPVWCALLLGLVPLLAFRGFIERAIALYQPYAWNRVNFDTTTIAYFDMVEAMRYPLAILVVVCPMFALWSRVSREERMRVRPRWLRCFVESLAETRLRIPLPKLFEAIPIFLLMAFPYVGWALASLHGGMFSARFVLPMCLGFAAFAAFMVFRTFGQVSGAGSFLLSAFLLWFMVRSSYVGFSYDEEKTALFSTYNALRQADHYQESIAVTDNLLILPFSYYAPPDIARRLVYPMDIRAIMSRRGEASGEINLWHNRAAYRFRMMPLAQFQRATFTYLMVCSEPDWLLDDLHANRYIDEVLPFDPHAQPLNYIATPLSHGPTEIIRVYSGRYPTSLFQETPIPFTLQGELPDR